METRAKTSKQVAGHKWTTVQAVFVISITASNYIGGQGQSCGIVITNIVGNDLQFWGNGLDQCEAARELASIGIGHGIVIISRNIQVGEQAVVLCRRRNISCWASSNF